MVICHSYVSLPEGSTQHEKISHMFTPFQKGLKQHELRQSLPFSRILHCDETWGCDSYSWLWTMLGFYIQ